VQRWRVRGVGWRMARDGVHKGEDDNSELMAQHQAMGEHGSERYSERDRETERKQTCWTGST
jgi:hypothetical protein